MNKSSHAGDAVFVLFSIVQVMDGWLTYLGMRVYGMAIEANPIIAWYTAFFGAAAALIGAKVFAISCGALLHLHARHFAVGLLTLGYLAAAISPWIDLLWN